MTKFILKPLPYSPDALAPFLSAETLHFHHDKHHQAYVNKLNELLPGSGFEGLSLTDIVKTAHGSVFNQAAQIWNHDFYWESLSPKKDQAAQGEIASALNAQFGSVSTFQKEFEAQVVKLFGSGWVWLAADPKTKKLSIVPAKDAENPLSKNLLPILNCDVWEHAYYIDYRNARADYAKKFWSHVNWEFAEKNFRGI